MRRILLGSLILAATTATAPLVYADDDHDDRYWGERRRDLYGDDYGYRSYGGSGLVNRVIRDLEFIGSRSYTDGHEARHFRRAIGELSEFEYRARRGKFDRGRLDNAIEHINHLSRADQLAPRDRYRLREHLYDLRRFRSDRGRYGYWSGERRYPRGW